MDKGQKTIKKELFYLRLLFSAKEKALQNFKSRLFPIKNLDKTNHNQHVNQYQNNQQNQPNTRNLTSNCIEN